MTQGYGPQDPNQPGYGPQPPQPTPYGAPTPAGYGQQPVGGYPVEAPGFFMGRRLANWLQRVGAALIDGLIGFVPLFIGGLLAGAFSPNNGTANTGAGLLVALLYLVSLGIWVYNRWILQGRTGQSWGKQVLRLRLLRMADGQPMGGGMAFVRDLVHILDGLPCALLPIGYLFPIWDARRQTFADKIMNTVVIAEA
jgi:uncharacterized RDD family membrane protein YckC